MTARLPKLNPHKPSCRCLAEGSVGHFCFSPVQTLYPTSRGFFQARDGLEQSRTRVEPESKQSRSRVCRILRISPVGDSRKREDAFQTKERIQKYEENSISKESIKMTKARLHPSLLEFNGAMGDMVFKKRGKKVYVSIKAKGASEPSEKQLAQRKYFKKAVNYATSAL